MRNYTPKTALDFKSGHNVSTDLKFGANSDKIVANVSIVLDAPRVSVNATYRLATINVNASIRISELPIVVINAEYNANVFRPISSKLLMKSETAMHLRQVNANEFAYTRTISSQTNINRETAKTLVKKADIRFENTKKVRSNTELLNETAKPVIIKKHLSFENTRNVRSETLILSETSNKNKIQVNREFYPCNHIVAKYSLGFDVAEYVRNSLKQAWSDATLLVKSFNLLSETSRVPPHPRAFDTGKSKPDYIPKTLLNFECPWIRPETKLDFGIHGCQYQPTKPTLIYDEVIFVAESASLVNVATGNEIDMFGGNVGIDSNSYLWSFDADIAYYENIPNNTLVELTVNGHKWRFLTHIPSESEEFNNNVSKKIVGFSQSILLSYPYIDKRAFRYDTATSAQQIINNELSLVSGFTADFQLNGGTNWQVPAKAYSYSDNTPINVLQDVAAAGGGFINSHPTDKQLIIKSNYPTESWKWNALSPSVTLDELIESYSVTPQQTKDFNGVWVTGEKFGVKGFVKRTGTDGAIQPEQVMHALLTEQSIAIHRAKAELSKYGTTYFHDVSTPLHNDIGLLTPSDFVSIKGKNAIVRSISISFNVDNRGALTIDNKLRLESK